MKINNKKMQTILMLTCVIINVAVIVLSVGFFGTPSDSINILTTSVALFFLILSIVSYFYNLKVINKFLLEGAQYQETIEKNQKEQKDSKKEADTVRKAAAENRQIRQMVNEINDGLDRCKDVNEFFDQLLINIAKPFNAVQGIAYMLNPETDKFESKSTYAYYTENIFKDFELGDGIPGQVAKDKQILLMDNVPTDYIHVTSGLGNGSPKYLVVIPLIGGKDKKTLAVIELATFEKTQININRFHSEINNVCTTLLKVSGQQK